MGALVWPKWAENADCTITLTQDGLNENGGPIQEASWSGRCILSVKRKKTIDTKGNNVMTQGSVTVQGDIAPNAPKVSGGVVTINGCDFKIGSVSRPTLPDGRVFHTRLELM